VLIGGPEAETLTAGSGPDLIEAQDGVVDTANCGPGVNVAIVDTLVTTGIADTVSANCETQIDG